MAYRDFVNDINYELLITVSFGLLRVLLPNIYNVQHIRSNEEIK